MSLESSLRTIFNEALDRTDNAERQRYLERACGADDVLRRRVERLLHAHDAAGNFLSQRDNGDDESGFLERPGQRIGRYKLLEQIGEGGCGSVYMAEQVEPVRRRVALKIIKLGMDTRSVVARFEAERQALAVMDHPNIAKVLDAGATDTGRPYFVMELVRGIKITDYCDQNQLTTDQRLQLFMQVCKAVQHAHTKGIIHRDLKPGNILVTLHDGVPVPKVIDFGIAKATGQERLTDKTLFTAFEQFVGTPAYMSPEQAEMSGLDIDTRTDIYSLGVLLYELLIGQTPFDSRELLSAGLDEMRRTIREKEPRPPSTRLATMIEGDLTETARHRHTDAPKLIHIIKGDLDWIVMKCLEKDRTRRYATALDPALDIERHLRNEPVFARPPNRIYQFKKLVRRNKVAFAASAAVIATLLGGVGLSTWLYVRERAALRIASDHSEKETKERVRAEEAVTRLEIERAELLFAQDDASRALAYLARRLRVQPASRVIGNRLLSALTHRNFCVPVAEPLIHGPPLRQDQVWDSKGPRHPLVTGQRIRSARFSPDDKFILTAARDGTAVIWRSDTGQPVVSLKHDDEVFWAEFSPDGQRVVTACRDHHAYLWSSASGARTAPPLKHEGAVTFAEFSRDGKRLVTASEDGTAKIWDASTGELLTGPVRHSDTIAMARFSPGDHSIVTTSYDGSARVWDAQTGLPRSPLRNQINSMRFADFSPDGAKIMGASATEITIWNAFSGELLKTFPHRGAIYAAGFSPDGNTLITADSNNTIRFWDAQDGRLFPRSIQQQQVQFLAMSADNKLLATASGDATARVWDLQTAKPVTEPLGHDSAVTIVAFSSDAQRLVTVTWFGAAYIWQLRPPASPALELPPGAGHFILGQTPGRFSPDSSHVAVADGHIARLWDVPTGQLTADFYCDLRNLASLDFSPDGKLLATASARGMIKVWDVEAKIPLLSLFDPIEVRGLRFSTDGRYLLTYSPGGLTRLTDARSGKVHRVFQDRIVEAADISPHGNRLVIGLRGDAVRGAVARIRDTESGEKIGAELQHDDSLKHVQFSRDGSRVVTASWDRTARLWDAETGKPILPPLVHAVAVSSAVFSPDDTLVLTVSGNSARLWDSRSGRPTGDLLRHGGRVNTARFSPNGHYVLTSSDDGSARVWDASSGFAISEPLQHSTAVTSAEFSPNGKWILTVDQSASAKLWEMPGGAEHYPGWLAGLAEAFAGQSLNSDEQFEHVAPVELWRIKEMILASERGPFSAWARWLFSEDKQRIVSPALSATQEENSRRIRARDALLRAKQYLRDLDWTNAVAEFSSVIALSPKNPEALQKRAWAFLKLGKPDLAEGDYRRAFELEPNHFASANDYAFFLCDMRKAPQQALPIALKAVESEPNHPTVVNTLGIVYYRLGQYKKAAETFERALTKKFEGYLVAWDLFGASMAYSQLGEISRAKEYFAKGDQWLSENPRWEFGVSREDVEPFRADAAALLSK